MELETTQFKMACVLFRKMVRGETNVFLQYIYPVLHCENITDD